MLPCTCSWLNALCVCVFSLGKEPGRLYGLFLLWQDDLLLVTTEPGQEDGKWELRWRLSKAMRSYNAKQWFRSVILTDMDPHWPLYVTGSRELNFFLGFLTLAHFRRLFYLLCGYGSEALLLRKHRFKRYCTSLIPPGGGYDWVARSSLDDGSGPRHDQP